MCFQIPKSYARTQPTLMHTEPTRIVDNIFVSSFNNLTSGNILEKTSYDHLANLVLFEAESTHNMKMDIKTRDIKNFDKESFITELHNLNEQISLNLSTNDSFNCFHRNFQNTLSKHAPLSYLTKREIKTTQKTWLTKGILISICIKRKLFISFKTRKIKKFIRNIKHTRDLVNTV